MNVLVPTLGSRPLSPPGRVLMTADAMGGVWQYALDLAEGLSRGGSEILLAVMGEAPGAEQRAAAAAIPGVHLVSAPYRLEWMEDVSADIDAAGVWLLTLARRFRPDVIHLNGYMHALLPWNAPVVVAAHSCVKTWWRAVHGEDPPPAWSDYGAAVARGLAAADAVIAPTAAFLAALQDAHGPVEAASVVYNGRAATGADPGAAEEPLILCAARLWDEAKNVACLDEAAAGLPWVVAVAGSSVRPDGGAHLGFSHVRPLGPLSPGELRSCFNRAGIFVSAALYEPFGLAILEAAQSGCALVLSDIPTLRELWDDAAVFVTPGDARALHRALATLIDEPDRRRTLGQAAVLRARRYSPRLMIEGTLEAYARAAARWSLALGSGGGGVFAERTGAAS